MCARITCRSKPEPQPRVGPPHLYQDYSGASEEACDDDQETETFRTTFPSEDTTPTKLATILYDPTQDTTLVVRNS